MDLFQSIFKLIFDAVRFSLVPIVRSLLLFYLVIAAILIFIRLVKGVRH